MRRWARDVQIVRDALRTWRSTGEPAWDLMHADAEVHDHDIVDAGEHRVVVLVRMKATGRGSSVSVEREDGLVYQLRDGLITRLDYYNNRAEALAAAGLAG